MKRRLKKIAQIEPDRGAGERAEQRAGAADRGQHDELARRFEGEGVRRHEALHHAEQSAGKAGIGRGDHEGDQLVAVDIVADGGRPQRIIANRPQHKTDRRAHDTHRDHDADEIPERQEHVERRIAVETEGGEAEIERRGRHAREPVLAARELRERVELDEIEHLGDRHRDHGEIDADTPERDQAHQIADGGGRDHADEQGPDDVRKARDRQQIGGDHAAGAEKGGLAERQQAGKAEQDVEAEAEQAPNQDAIDRGGGKSEIRQYERRGDQPGCRQRFDEIGTLLEHQTTVFIRGRPSRAARKDEAPAPASSPRKA